MENNNNNNIDKSKIDINSDNINEYYTKVNELIDTYFEWNVKPSALKRYFKNGGLGMKKFIDRSSYQILTI